MIVWVVDLIAFVLLCVGSKLAMPRSLRLLCRVAAFYVFAFTICYYLWLASRYRYFEQHPHIFQSGIAMAFRFEGFWTLLGNMVLMQAIFPVAVIITLFLGFKWLSAGLTTNNRR
jgi:hypothetical protein